MPEFASRAVVLGLRIAQALLAIIVLGLTAYVASWWHTYWHHSAPGQIAFAIFSAVWTILALVYLIVVPWRYSDTKAHHKFAILGVEALTMIFWFAGFIALAVWISNRTCFGSVCSSAKAATVFAALEWLCFAATTAMAVMHVMRTRDRHSRNDKAAPNMNVAEGV